MIDHQFVARVEQHLGPAQEVDVTGSGRTVLSYPDFTVSPEGSTGRPVAARVAGGSLKFALVKGPELTWQGQRPSGEPYKQPHRARRQRRAVAA